eukprot:31473-Pelagococcus_subviridis.AAC.15
MTRHRRTRGALDAGASGASFSNGVSTENFFCSSGLVRACAPLCRSSCGFTPGIALLDRKPPGREMTVGAARRGKRQPESMKFSLAHHHFSTGQLAVPKRDSRGESAARSAEGSARREELSSR